MAYRILVIDDDENILRLIRNILNLSEYEVTTRSSINEVNLCDFMGFDLILLDIMMPLNGLDICRQIRSEVNAPIIFITAKDMEEDLIDGIEVGADDYIIKPFTVKEFLARVKMHLRREDRHKDNKNILDFDKVKVDISLQRVFIEKIEVKLTKREFLIISMLAGNSNKVFSIEEIYDRVYPSSSDTQFRSISEYIYQIRNKFKVHGINPFETMRGGGYRWNIQSVLID